jgi:putative chitinase
MNGLANPDILLVGQQLNVPCTSPLPPPPPLSGCSIIVHRVQPGDTVLVLAWRYNSTVEAVVTTNHLANPNLIYVGQRLCIP